MDWGVDENSVLPLATYPSALLWSLLCRCLQTLGRHLIDVDVLLLLEVSLGSGGLSGMLCQLPASNSSRTLFLPKSWF